MAAENLKEAGIGIGLLVVVVVIMTRVVQLMRDMEEADLVNQTNASHGFNLSEAYAYNVTGQGLGAMETFGDWFDVIVIVLIASVVVALLTFGFGRGRA